ncbi:hypothetical protein DEO72_LG10g3127 [Vigna unguiculata]|uniref:Uncharacterized protein n=1 Tax=Vigna unguiculata TaxID=3917 RepID=A0A4D6NH43_VIGUN|nr:hypothetical protein DEO72_LG10g3127 [Vigna unguiculata]
MKHHAQVRGSHLSENLWVPLVFRLVVAQARDLTFGRRAVSVRQEVSPKRELTKPVGLSVGSLA